MKSREIKTDDAKHGGSRPGAGRPRGAPNRKTRELQQAVAASGITPLDFMLSVMRNEAADLAERLEAAKSAAPYVHPKLATIDVNATVSGTVVIAASQADEQI